MPPKKPTKPTKPTRSGSTGESKTGLVITLIFFILATIGLGVATYYGFAEQEKLTKEKKGADDTANLFKEERNWYQFQTQLFRQYMGSPAKDMKQEDFAQKKANFDKFLKDGAATSLPFKGKAIDETKDDVRTFVNNLTTTMPFDGATPKATYETRIKALEDAYRALENSAKQVRGEKLESDKRAADAEAKLKEAEDAFNKARVKLEAEAKKDREADRLMIRQLSTNLEEKQKEKDTSEVARADAAKKLGIADTARARAESQLTGLKEAKNQLEEDLKGSRNALADLRSRVPGLDAQREESDRQDREARNKLEKWNKDWQVVMLDRRGEMPYINLGSNDRVSPQLTFSLHSVGLDGRLSPTRKATLEIVQVVGPNLSRARLTWVRNRDGDPVVKGDRLFNSTWDPNRKAHVALVGVMDLGDDGRDRTEDFLAYLKRQGIEVDTYMDPKDLTLKGPGLNSNTLYLIEGKRLDNTLDPRGRDKGLADRVDKMIRDAKASAKTEGVSVIGLNKYLDQIGYRGSRASDAR